jgi:hypothetical protein
MTCLDTQSFNNVLILGKTWPESSASAAGIRIQDIMRLLAPQCSQVHFASAAQRSEHSDDMGCIVCHTVQINDDGFDTWIAALNPDLVIFDRFMTEEQFGWRVQDHCPEAIRVLDTSDFHGLRHAREVALKTQAPVDLYNEIALREYAAIARCDLTLLISPIERDLLIDAFHIDPDLLYWLPFIQPRPDEAAWTSFESRQHMLFVGGYKHAPNVDAVQWLKAEIWPLIRAQLPTVECHIYGPYAPVSITQLHQPKQGFYVQGRVDDIRLAMQSHRVNLVPLRYGAGNKGKVIDGWATGTATAMTPVAAEGMVNDFPDDFHPSDSAVAFAEQAVRLYQDAAYWQAAQAFGRNAIIDGTDADIHGDPFVQRLFGLKNTLSEHRHRNILGRLLSQQQYRANEFLSRWITLKNTLT